MVPRICGACVSGLGFTSVAVGFGPSKLLHPVSIKNKKSDKNTIFCFMIPIDTVNIEITIPSTEPMA